MKHVGIIGGGQLARMLALAGVPMGVRFSFLLDSDHDDSCVYLLGDTFWYNKEQPVSAEEIYQQMGCPDVITIESENVDIELLRELSAFTKVAPNVEAIEQLRSRINEKLLLTQSGIQTSRYFPFFSSDDLVMNSGMLKFPVVVKSSFGGYDGKQQYRFANRGELLDVDLPEAHNGYIAEEFVKFERELSFIAVRSSKGKVLFYPATENTHKQSILVQSLAPASHLPKRLVKKARSNLAQLMHKLDYVGVMAMECFLVKVDGEEDIWINEIAPRVHNSGHWTQSGALTSQFENHIRAILDLPLGSTRQHGFSAMVNVLGMKQFHPAYLSEHTSLHWYDKKFRDGRKMGHVNIRCDSLEKMNTELNKLSRFFEGGAA